MPDYCDEINCENCYIPSYCMKYARLREEAEKQSELVQSEWLSPVEAAGLRAELERVRAAAEALLEESIYWTKRRCADVGEEYGQGTDAERAMRQALFSSRTGSLVKEDGV
jgi:hypothetical protein